MEHEVTHKEIYDRLIAVEGKIDCIDTNTKGIVEAFKALDGAFKVLSWIGKAAAPIIWIVGIFGVVSVTLSSLGKK